MAKDESAAPPFLNEVLRIVPSTDWTTGPVVAMLETESATHYLSMSETLDMLNRKVFLLEAQVAVLQLKVAELQRVPGNGYSSIVTKQIEDGE